MSRALRTVRAASVRLAMRPVLAGVALAFVGACGHQVPVETGLNKDVALAEQLQRRNAPTLVSTQELSPLAQTAAQATTHVTAPAPIVRTHLVVRVVDRAPVVRGARSLGIPVTATRVTAPIADRAASGEVVATEPAAPAENGGPVRDGGADGGVYRTNVQNSAVSTTANAPIYRQQVQAHTARDGVLASIAGAIIGAAASHGDRVRGGLIGAVAGGTLGAIYGHSVDRTYADAQSVYPSSPSTATFRRSPRYRGTI